MENKVFHDRFLLKNEKIKHFFRIMKITTLLLFVGILSIYAEDSYSQKARVTINEKNIRLDKVLTEIEKQTDYLFIYNDKVETDQKVSVKANTKPVYQVLNDLFKETNVNYSMEGSHIILSNRNEQEVSSVNTPLQEGKTITGKVQDEQGEPLVGVSVAVKGTTTGTVTDINGGYTLKVTNPNATLVFSFIGFLSQEVELKGQSLVNITLTEDVKILDEIVVVGYGVQRKIDVTGSISVTKSDEILKQQSFGALDGLKGKASGVNIFSNSGQPGGASRVMIRGIGTINASSNPLYVVDGVAMDDFKFLNPNDIERVEVLKDASSAAIYGARGANGVILVTTKRGLTGTGVKISYNGSVSMSTMANYIDVMNSEEWMEAFMIGQANANKYQGKNYSLNVKDYFKDPNLFTSDGKPIYDTDWQKEATRTAFSHNHQLSIQQGGKDSSVGAFLNYTDQQGIMLNSYMKRLNAKMAYDAKPTAWPDRLANPDLKWEKTYTFDVGIELGLFRNRLNFDVSYYNKKTKDLLLARPVPYHTGYSSVMSNMGEVTNQGVDILISSTNVETSDFTWGTTLNMNYNKNKINALGENNEDIFPDPSWVSGPQTILRVGESLSSFWGYERLGIWTEEDKAAGRIPSGQIVGQAKRSAEKKVLGKGIPDITGSFINNFRYKNFDMTVDMQFVLGVDVLQQFTHSLEDRFGLTNGEKAILYDAWSPSNPNTIVQAIRNGARDGQSSELDSRWVADGSYLRANLIQLGYTFNPKMIKPLSLSSLRVYFGVNNAFLIKSSDFRGYDPEATSQGDNQWGQNMFFFQYPKPRTFTFGVSATF